MTSMNEESLTEELSGVPEGQIILLETNAEHSLDVSLSAMRIITRNKKATAIILSASRPCTNLLMLYQKNNIPIDHLLILDCICKTPPVSAKALTNIIHLGDVSALTSISLAVTESLKKITGSRLVVIDSINTMLIHNQPSIFGKFIHGLLTRMRLVGAGGILLSLEAETDKMIRAEIAQLCDKVIKA